ncbi:hypothetical protein GCM10025867_13000 [Frondihabitans sucicola]|uniref:Prepilin-type N-terminal cleavage/methylation domain-containing protein n=1 Tax=Frondihabitans sucicola TaxID=1268041 RepID=A0ABN6XVX0_9MICO|nr:prepilin-type N-terminal cleavage/methylation domain-containing protein [Frondihabitans sucicola]BDZ49059.1 hypothetical protein GCM10025867_13000 [Frondihabitans sucicola]
MSLSRFRARLRPAALRGDAGVSLSELLVAMVILAVLMSVVMAFFVTSSKTFATNKAIDGNTRTASNAMNEVSRVLRAATPNPKLNNTTDPAFVSATATSVVFYAYINLTSSLETPVQVRFTYSAAAGTITESRWVATGLTGGLWSFPSASSTPASSRVIGTAVLPASSSVGALFSYLGADGTPIAFVSSAIPSTSLGSIASVKFAISSGTSSTAGQATNLVNTIGLPNVGIARTS